MFEFVYVAPTLLGMSGGADGTACRGRGHTGVKLENRGSTNRPPVLLQKFLGFACVGVL